MVIQKEAITYYFLRNYGYETISGFLERFHDIRISRLTHLNRLTEYTVLRFLRRRERDFDKDEDVALLHKKRT